MPSTAKQSEIKGWMQLNLLLLAAEHFDQLSSLSSCHDAVPSVIL